MAPEKDRSLVPEPFANAEGFLEALATASGAVVRSISMRWAGSLL